PRDQLPSGRIVRGRAPGAAPSSARIGAAESPTHEGIRYRPCRDGPPRRSADLVPRARQTRAAGWGSRGTARQAPASQSLKELRSAAPANEKTATPPTVSSRPGESASKRAHCHIVTRRHRPSGRWDESWSCAQVAGAECYNPCDNDSADVKSPLVS